MSKILADIAAILNKAENTDNEHEREAYMHAAYVKSQRHGIDLTMARAFTAKNEKREEPTHRRIILSEGYGRRVPTSLKHFVSLFSAIAGPNDVRINIAHNSTYVIAFGLPSDIDMTEALYMSLVVQMSQASEAYIKSGEYKKEVVGRWVKVKTGEYYDYYKGRYLNEYDEKWVEKPVDGRVARSSFMQAFLGKVGSRLWEARAEAEKAAKEQQAASLSPTVENREQEVEQTYALVLKTKAQERDAYYKKTSTARGSYKGYSASAGSSSAASNAGRKAGENARLGGSRAIA